MRRFFLICSLCFACSATCGTVQPTPPPTPINYGDVCAHLIDIGCPEGVAPNCVATFSHIQGDRMTDLRPQCLLNAGDRGQARLCGSIDCP